MVVAGALACTSSDWKEAIGPDEDARFKRQGERLRAVHAAKSARYGKGRLLHRKPVGAFRATFETLADRPDAARHGLSPSPGSHDAIVRLSNSSFDIQANSNPTFAVWR